MATVETTFALDQVLNASDMTIFFVQMASVVKSVDESVTSSTTTQDDDQLAIAVEPNTVYWVECFVMYSGAAAADIKTTYSGPTGAVFEWCPDSNTSAATATVGPVSRSRQGLGNTPSHGCLESSGSPQPLCALHKGVLTTSSTGGLLQFRWAQLASSSTPSKILAGSTLMATRIS